MRATRRPAFDRLGVHIGHLPYLWVDRINPGGVIVAPMGVDMATGPLVRFVVGQDGIARDRAVPWLKVEFMGLRSHRVASADFTSLQWDDASAEQSSTDLAPWVPLLADDHRWPIAVALPGCRYDVWKATEDWPGVALAGGPAVGIVGQRGRRRREVPGPPVRSAPVVGCRRDGLPVVAGTR